MKLQKLLLIAICCLATLKLSAQDKPQYNKALADSLGADDYGMKSYVLAILKPGPAKIEDQKTMDSIFRGHMANIKKLAAEGKLIVAGPLENNDRNYRGIFILNVKTVDDAKALVATDPAIKAGVFETELYGWYGSAALPAYLPYSKMVSKKSY